jgi:RNA polymerase sigma factor (sigma-70 family)
MSEPERSLAAIYERYHQSLYRFCFSIVGNAEDAQDALQNAMVKALRALPAERRQIQLKPWLYRIAHNESIEILRKRHEQVQVDPELVASTAGPEETAALRERLRRLLADLAGLPQRQRAAVVMRELGGLSFEEIGEAFETSAAVARQTIYEARLSLQQLEAGREMSCDVVMRQISDADGRTLRRRDVQAHLESCSHCREFRDSIEGRHRDLAAIAPLPAAASTGILHALLSGAGGHAGAGASAAGTLGAGAGKVAATSAVLKTVATVAVVAVGVTAADRSGVIDAGLPGGGGTTHTTNTTQEVRQATAGESGAGDSAAPAGPEGSKASLANGREAGRSGTSSAGEANPGKGNGPAASGATGEAGDQAQGSPGELPAAAQHGQETAAAHKAEPNSSSTAKAHGNSAGVGHPSHGGSGHSHGHATRSHGHPVHTHGGGRSHGGTAHAHPHPHAAPAGSAKGASGSSPNGANKAEGRQSDSAETPAEGTPAGQAAGGSGKKS